MPFTFDPTTPRGQVRLIIGDTNEAAPIFDDASIDAFLAMAEDGDVKLAAATAMETIASNQALMLKKVKVGDISTDGPAVADALRKHAQALRDEVREGGMIGSSSFEIVEFWP